MRSKTNNMPTNESQLLNKRGTLKRLLYYKVIYIHIGFFLLKKIIEKFAIFLKFSINHSQLLHLFLLDKGLE